MNAIFRYFLGMLLIFYTTLGYSALSPPQVPSSLKPWTDWLLYDHPQHDCPYFFNQTQKQCHWATALKLNIAHQAQTAADYVTWQQDWYLDSEGWVQLPGNDQYWPQNVIIKQKLKNNQSSNSDPPATDNGSSPHTNNPASDDPVLLENETTSQNTATEKKSAIVINQQGKPAVWLSPGHYQLQGEFHWQQQPEYLPVPSETGLIELTVNEEKIDIPELDAQGRLWLRQRGETIDEDKTLENRLDIKVYRHLLDSIPLQIITRIELDVSGKHREEVLGPAMLADHIPMQLNSSLPARLEPDGRLRLQVRPGSWVISLKTRHVGPVNELHLPEASALWPDEEVWVFAAKNELRWVEVQGVTTVDPQQTTLPQNWQQLPAYRLQTGDTLVFAEKRRGNPEPAPDQLRLERNFWLDFDGRGYSVQDRINGTMTRGWRLEMQQPAQLGRVNVNGKDQLITQLEESSNAGVEVRRGKIQLIADSRLEEALQTFSITGWQHEFQQVRATLHLPPGWRLINAEGVDNVYETWINRWSLLDIFVVLIISIAVAKLWQWYWGGLMLMTLILVYQEPLAPQYVWLNVLAALALLRVLPEMGWFSWLVRWYRNLSLLGLIIIAIQFISPQVQQSLYPQLEYRGARIGSTHFQRTETDNWEGRAASSIHFSTGRIQSAPAPQEKAEMNYYDSDEIRMKQEKSRKQLIQIDPKANVQTGPGLPQWAWQKISFHWNGPVNQNQTIQLWLIPPIITQLLGFLKVLLVTVLALFFLWQGWGKRILTPKPPMASTGDNGTKITTSLAVLGLAGLFSMPLTTQAQTVFPPSDLLKQLESRLTEPPDCLPNCAASPKMALELRSDSLLMRMTVHSQIDTVIPLPGIAGQWLAQTVLLNDQPVTTLKRGRGGYLWLKVPQGIQQIQLQGPLPNRNNLQLPLPLKPHQITVTTQQGWEIFGLHENGVADDQLQFTREQQAEEAAALEDLEMGSLPPFVQVERTLLLGLDWQVETSVTRLTPLGSAAVLEIPLLAGESVTSEKIRVENGKALINLSPQQQHLRWSSVFDKQPTLELIAADNLAMTEIWRLDVSAIWHVDIDGIPVVHHQDEKGNWLPEWRPWPGEKVKLTITRPQPINGQILTIDRSELTVTPGLRATENRLSLHLRSSQGVQHSLTLPENAVLQSISINGIKQPLRQENQKLTLPITPGEHDIVILFRQPRGIERYFTTSPIDLGQESVNTHITLHPPGNRWILWTDTTPMGPAVMMWSLILVILIVSIALGMTRQTPLKTWEWFLLALVLAQIRIETALIVVIWLFALHWRANLPREIETWKFNATQVGLVLLTLVSLGILLVAVRQGLLGHPNMYILGNESTTSALRWYQDRTDGILPSVWIYSLSVWVYRLAILIWALWLAFALLRWLKWGWECFSTDGLWRRWEWTWPWHKKASPKPNS